MSSNTENPPREDEWHVLTCPLYADLRTKHFGSETCFAAACDDASLRQLFNGSCIRDDREWRRFWRSFSAYIADMNALRSSMHDDGDGRALPEVTSFSRGEGVVPPLDLSCPQSNRV